MAHMLYVLTFEVASASDDQLDQIESHFDVISSEGHGAPEITALVEAADAPNAFQAARRAIGEAGVRIVRFLPDLVTRAEIARRAGLTTQAVGNYVRGDRRDHFPEPYLHVPDSVWLWSEVLEWFRARCREIQDAGHYPTRLEAEAFTFKIWDEVKVNGGWAESTTIRTSIQPAPAAERTSWTGSGYSLTLPKTLARIGAAG